MALFFSPHFFSPRVHLLFIPLFSPPQASSLHSLLTSVQTPSLIILLGSFSLSLTLDVVALFKPTPFIRLSLGTCLVHHSAIYLSILFFCFPIITPVQTVYCPCPSLCDHCFHPPCSLFFASSSLPVSLLCHVVNFLFWNRAVPVIKRLNLRWRPILYLISKFDVTGQILLSFNQTLERLLTVEYS